MKRTALVLSLLSLFALACATGMSDSPAVPGSAAAASGNFSPSHYRLVSDPDMVIPIVWNKLPRGYHVKAQLTAGAIVWSPKIEGSGPLCADGKEWISLATGVIHPETETPVAPYLSGCRASNGLFQPASTQVTLQ